jgi:inorganic phosphate transporter, PiT family
MLLGFISGLTTEASLLFLVCILAVCIFEAINGFHDTANAVATVIYTKTLPPMFAVVWSGCWNFLGALFGGIAVAMGIVKLMPLNDLMTVPLSENIVMVLSILLAAIIWNLGTWYLGIPCSSSHALIGALLGGGFAFWIVHSGTGPNWSKAKDIGLSLLVSPLFGFSLAIMLMYVLRIFFKKEKTIFKSPDDTNKKPPIWIRAVLITTCTLVSYFHGNNDGQKGVGLALVVLMAFLPMNFAIDPNVSSGALANSTRKIEAAIAKESSLGDPRAGMLTELASNANLMAAQLDTAGRTDRKEIYVLRNAIQKFNNTIEGNIKGGIISGEAAKICKAEIKTLKASYEFSPTWVVAMIAICLGIGTMVGWKRIVVTIGEKIGKSHLTYAQGASAELCAAAVIGVSSASGLPVSTTHVLSSGIAGTMVAQGGIKNLQRSTIKSIAIAWLLTLPVTFGLAFILFFLMRFFA